MFRISQFSSYSAPNLVPNDERYDEVKRRGTPYAYSPNGSNHDLPRPPSERFPAAGAGTGRQMAAQLRKSVSMQALSKAAHHTGSQDPTSLQGMLINLNMLKDYVSRIKFVPDVRRHQIRREVMKNEVQDFRLNKTLERTFYAIYAAQNLKNIATDCLSNDEIFRRSVVAAVRSSKLHGKPNDYNILWNKYKTKNGMSDKAATLSATASILALPLARAAHTVAPRLMRRMNEGNWRGDSPHTHKKQDRHATNTGIDIDAQLGLSNRSASMESRIDDAELERTLRSEAKTPAAILEGISKLVTEKGMAALAELDETDAIELDAFRGNIQHLMEIMRPQSSTDTGVHHSTGQA
ncbi:hypothetical protein [Noviherbaspirillum malthae]|uniref:hypothetical protein n=1 Tax=Noviherbaspirillum malthae TaxID=1260987 RepID=UPI00188F5CB8|nr:hypothetical protein [Noviherbaspirillum malthae]